MRKSQFIFVLMLGSSFATMARADDTSLANCLKAAGEGNCVRIGDSDTYYALSGDEGNQTMTIYGTNADGTAATVPEYAFNSTFPEGITSLKTSGNVDIGNGAFEGSEGLTSIDLTGVQSIGWDAFAATGLTGHLDLTGVQSIGYEAFWNAWLLTSVDLTGVQSIGGHAFEGAENLTSANLTGVQTIDDSAFYGAYNLTSIVISDSLLDAGGNILEYAKRDGVFTGIDPYAFSDSGLNTIYCPAGKTCDNSFEGLSDTPTIISYSKNDDGTYSVGENMYANADMMTKNIACENADQCAALQRALNAGNTCEAQDACNTLAQQYAAASEPETPSAPARADIRIYTIDEANAVAGKVNSVKIRYR